MKIRLDFVTNSSSSSFVILMNYKTNKDAQNNSKEKYIGSFVQYGGDMETEEMNIDCMNFNWSGKSIDFNPHSREPYKYWEDKYYTFGEDAFRGLFIHLLSKLGLSQEINNSIDERLIEDFEKSITPDIEEIEFIVTSEGRGEDSPELEDAFSPSLKEKYNEGQKIDELAKEYETDVKSVKYFLKILDLVDICIEKRYIFNLKNKTLKNKIKVFEGFQNRVEGARYHVQ